MRKPYEECTAGTGSEPVLVKTVTVFRGGEWPTEQACVCDCCDTCSGQARQLLAVIGDALVKTEAMRSCKVLSEWLDTEAPATTAANGRVH